jgi:hypothetical protein
MFFKYNNSENLALDEKSRNHVFLYSIGVIAFVH